MNTTVFKIPALRVTGRAIPDDELELIVREVRPGEDELKFEVGLCFGDSEAAIRFEAVFDQETLKGEVKIRPDVLLWAAKNGATSQAAGMLEYIICQYATLAIIEEEEGSVFLDLFAPKIGLRLEQHFYDPKLNRFLTKWKKTAQP